MSCIVDTHKQRTYFTLHVQNKILLYYFNFKYAIIVTESIICLRHNIQHSNIEHESVTRLYILMGGSTAFSENTTIFTVKKP